jgi:hypothetical protein
MLASVFGRRRVECSSQHQLHDVGRPQYQDVGAGRKVWTLYQTFDSEGVSDALTINGIIMDAATKPKHIDRLSFPCNPADLGTFLVFTERTSPTFPMPTPLSRGPMASELTNDATSYANCGTETVCRADGWRAVDLGVRSIFSPGGN